MLTQIQYLYRSRSRFQHRNPDTLSRIRHLSTLPPILHPAAVMWLQPLELNNLKISDCKIDIETEFMNQSCRMCN